MLIAGLGLADVPVLFIVVGCVYYGLGGFCLWFGWFRFWAVCLLQVGWGVCSVCFAVGVCVVLYSVLGSICWCVVDVGCLVAYSWLLLRLRVCCLIVLISWFFVEVFSCLVVGYLTSLCLVCCVYLV